MKENKIEHYTLKEIHEQSAVVQACLDAFTNQSIPALGEHIINLGFSSNFYLDINQIQIIACGSSLYASLVGKYLFEQVAKVPTIVHDAAEFRDAPPPPTANTLIIGVTQSGETADTLAALEIEKNRRVKQRLLGITNKTGSSLEKLVDHTIHTQAGIEVAIAATKTFLAQLIAFYCLALDLAYYRQISAEQLHQIMARLRQIPAKIDIILQTQKEYIEKLAQDLKGTENWILLGRGINFSIALEGALKLKEISYIHAEGYHSGEFLHGPIAILDSKVAVVAIAMPGVVYEKVLANAQKAKACGVRLIGVTSIKSEIFDDVLSVPEVDELLSPLLTVIPLQLLAYYLGVHRGVDVDRPRNLTKAITHE